MQLAVGGRPPLGGRVAAAGARVYRVDVNGVRTEEGLGGIVVMRGQAEYLLASGLDAAQSYNIR